MAENIAEHFLGQLETSTNPGATLSQFYISIAEIPYNNRLIPTMNKLVTIYGRRRVFYAILSIANSNLEDPYKVFGLLSHICKKSLEESHETSMVINTEQLEKKLEVKRKLRVDKDIFDD